MKITVGQITDRGLNPKRTANEDSLLAIPERGLFLVADGVGGRRGGEVASQTVAEIFGRVFQQNHSDDLQSVISSTIDLCNQKIYEDSESNPELEGMATTLALVVVEGTRAVVAHVGDSRVYRCDVQGLICLTEDHSEVNDALRAGKITEEQAESYPRRNVINRALGAEPEVEPDMIEIDIDEQTSFFLCSDGITRHIPDEEILRLMMSGRRPQTICEQMKNICYAGGAEDNLTALIVDFGRRNYVEEPTKPAKPAPAMSAKAAPSGRLPIPRPVKRIEVDLSRGADRANPEPPTALLAKAPEPVRVAGRDATAVRVPNAPGSQKSPAAGGAQKVETSEVMRLSLIGGSLLLAGILIGSLFGRPIANRFNQLIGRPDPYVQKGVTVRPGDAEVDAAYARHLEGKSDEAREQLNKVLTDHPNHAEALFYLGLIDSAQGKFDDAINHLGQAAKLDPKLPDVQVHLAMAYLSIGQMRNARDILQQVLTPAASPLPSGAPSASPAASGMPGG